VGEEQTLRAQRDRPAPVSSCECACHRGGASRSNRAAQAGRPRSPALVAIARQEAAAPGCSTAQGRYSGRMRRRRRACTGCQRHNRRGHAALLRRVNDAIDEPDGGHRILQLERGLGDATLRRVPARREVHSGLSAGLSAALPSSGGGQKAGGNAGGGACGPTAGVVLASRAGGPDPRVYQVGCYFHG
jgi:hypothetical protein